MYVTLIMYRTMFHKKTIKLLDKANNTLCFWEFLCYPDRIIRVYVWQHVSAVRFCVVFLMLLSLLSFHANEDCSNRGQVEYSDL